MSDSNERDDFTGQRTMDVTVISNTTDGAEIDINGTRLKISQYDDHAPALAKIWVGTERQPIGTINTERGKTACLGGIEEGLADRVEEISDMPIKEIPEALARLAYRLNPAGREVPNGVQKTANTKSKAGIQSGGENDDEKESCEQQRRIDALGGEIPVEQRDAARKEAEKMGVDIDKGEWVDKVARFVEADQPNDAIMTARKQLDITDMHQFLTTLCTPVDKNP